MKKSVLFLFMALCSVGLMAQSAVTGPVNAAPAPSVETVLQNAVTGIFSGAEVISPFPAEVKEINSFSAVTDIDMGIVNIYSRYMVNSNLEITLSVRDANNKKYIVRAYIFKGEETDIVYPKYDADIIMADIISITPQEDEMYYYTFY